MSSSRALTFRVDAASGQQIGEKVARGRIFVEESIVVAGELQVHVFAGKQVCRIDLFGDAAHAPILVTADTNQEAVGVEVSEEEYERGISTLQQKHEDRQRAFAQGDPIDVFTHFVDLTGESTFLRFHLSMPSVLEQRRFLHRLFSMPQLGFRNLQGGISVINPAQLSHANFHAGAEPPVGSWRGEFIP